MNSIIREALKEALTETMQELIEEIDSGKFDMVNIECSCGQLTHGAKDAYCGNCGKKLERTDDAIPSN